MAKDTTPPEAKTPDFASLLEDNKAGGSEEAAYLIGQAKALRAAVDSASGVQGKSAILSQLSTLMARIPQGLKEAGQVQNYINMAIEEATRGLEDAKRDEFTAGTTSAAAGVLTHVMHEHHYNVREKEFHHTLAEQKHFIIVNSDGTISTVSSEELQNAFARLKMQSLDEAELKAFKGQYREALTGQMPDDAQEVMKRMGSRDGYRDLKNAMKLMRGYKEYALQHAHGGKMDEKNAQDVREGFDAAQRQVDGILDLHDKLAKPGIPADMHKALEQELIQKEKLLQEFMGKQIIEKALLNLSAMVDVIKVGEAGDMLQSGLAAAAKVVKPGADKASSTTVV